MSEFDFDFEGTDRDQLLVDAANKSDHMFRDLGPEAGADASPAAQAAQAAAGRLLEQLRVESAELSAELEVVRLERSHFEGVGLKLPPLYDQLAKDHDFYWVRVPLILKPLEHMPFEKLKCGIEFLSEGVRPVAQIVLPDKKFKKLLELSDQLALAVNESFELDVAQRVDAAAGAVKGQVGVSAGAKLALDIGPFSYRLMQAEIDHSGSGSHKVFWSIAGAQHVHEQEPTLLVVIRVPKATRQVQIAAALQAYHSFRPLAATLGQLIGYVAGRLKRFFKAGAPVEAKRVWDISSRLTIDGR
jgi:hypothetical protein